MSAAKRWLCGGHARACAGSLLVTLALAACTTTTRHPGTTEDKILQDMRAKAGRIVEAGGLAAVGLGEAGILDIATERAQNRGRQGIASVIQDRLFAVQKALGAEIGEIEALKYSPIFSAAVKLAASNAMRESAAVEVQHQYPGAVVRAYVLMVHEPKCILDAIAASQEDANQELYSKFRASQTYKDLEARIRAAKDYKAVLAAGRAEEAEKDTAEERPAEPAEAAETPAETAPAEVRTEAE
ncbi:MAG: hypothetical protein JXR37_06765 [Kiritimatiellae bacterium]|nr:hypothetical protein [Kiritimatiellia bacterium]